MNLNLQKNSQPIFLGILSIIILFQLFQLYKKESVIYDNSESSYSDIDTYNETDSPANQPLIHSANQPTNTHNKLERYGQPTNIYDDKDNRIIYWKFSNYNPWSTLYYNKTKDIFTFGITQTISKDLLLEWTKIIPNIGVNEKDNQLMITTSDEESALAILNLILSTIHNELTLEEILTSKLIDISVAKIKAHPLVKTKILEQITEKLQTSKEHISSDHSLDLATNKLNIGAYGGNEFSFLG